jgi:hypothetical protein
MWHRQWLSISNLSVCISLRTSGEPVMSHAVFEKNWYVMGHKHVLQIDEMKISITVTGGLRIE